MSDPVMILPDLYFLPALKPASNIYLISTERKKTLIDTGIRENRLYLEEQLKYLNLSFTDIDDIIYTHCHYDHTGGGEFFPNAVVYSHPLCKAKIEYQDESSIHALKYQTTLPSRIPDKILGLDDIYQNGIYTFNVLYTPGHSDDGICLVESDHQILISGDTVFARGIPALITDSGSDASLLYSMNLLQKYDIKYILPGHGKIDHNGNVTILTTKTNIIHRIKDKNTIIIEKAKSCGLKKY